MASHTESIAFRVFLVLNVGEGFATTGCSRRSGASAPQGLERASSRPICWACLPVDLVDGFEGLTSMLPGRGDGCSRSVLKSSSFAEVPIEPSHHRFL
jgi:hypothetical protein